MGKINTFKTLCAVANEVNAANCVVDCISDIKNKPEEKLNRGEDTLFTVGIVILMVGCVIGTSELVSKISKLAKS